MIKQAPHSAESKTSMTVLARRVKYIADPDDKNHQNKQVLPSKNHHCRGQAAEDFVQAIEEGVRRYCLYREGKRGKCTKRRWEEYCYSSQEGTLPRSDGSGMEPCLNEVEREKLEQGFLAGPIGRAPVRFGWHIDSITGRCDCHFLVGVHDDQGVIWMNDGFGHGKKNLKLLLERIEEEIIDALNRRRMRDRQLKTARQRHEENRRKAGKFTFAQKLAIAGWGGKPESLPKAARLAGYDCLAQTVKSITVQSIQVVKRPKKNRYTLATLTINWAKAKALLDRKKHSVRDDPEMEGPSM